MEQSRFILYLDDRVAQVLLAMSRNDCRTPTQETVWILSEEAKRRGLLLPHAQPEPSAPQDVSHEAR